MRVRKYVLSIGVESRVRSEKVITKLKIGNIHIKIGNIHIKIGNIHIKIGNIHIKIGNMHIKIGNIHITLTISSYVRAWRTPTYLHQAD